MLGGASEGSNEALELTSGDGEHAGLSRFNLVGVRNAFGRQQRLPGTGLSLFVSDAVTHLTFENMEDFILIMVDM